MHENALSGVHFWRRMPCDSTAAEGRAIRSEVVPSMRLSKSSVSSRYHGACNSRHMHSKWTVPREIVAVNSIAVMCGMVHGQRAPKALVVGIKCLIGTRK